MSLETIVTNLIRVLTVITTMIRLRNFAREICRADSTDDSRSRRFFRRFLRVAMRHNSMI